MSGFVTINGRRIDVPDGHVLVLGDGPARFERMEGPPDVKETPCGRLKVGMRVRLSRSGWARFRPGGEDEARAALSGVRITQITGPMTDGPRPAYAVEVDGALEPFLWCDDDFVEAK